jgi:Flp pilus assembly protein TadD
MNPAAAQSAAKLYQAAIDRAPQDHMLRENYAEFLETVGDVKGALAQWRQEQPLMPYDWEPFFQAGRLLAQLEQWDEAEAALKQALKLRPSTAEGWRDLGGVRLATGRFGPALQDYNRARLLEPQNPAYCVDAGLALSKLNRHAEAVQNFRFAIQLEPELWQSHLALGHELWTLNQLAEAGREFAEVVRLQPGNARAHLNYGVLLTRLGRLDEAQHEFEATLQLEPANADAREYLARALALKRGAP